MIQGSPKIPRPISHSRSFDSIQSYLADKNNHLQYQSDKYKDYLETYFTIITGVIIIPDEIPYRIFRQAIECKKYCFKQLKKEKNQHLDIDLLFLNAVERFADFNGSNRTLRDILSMPEIKTSIVNAIFNFWESIKPSLIEENQLARKDAIIKRIEKFIENRQAPLRCFAPLRLVLESCCSS